MDKTKKALKDSRAKHIEWNRHIEQEMHRRQLEREELERRIRIMKQDNVTKTDHIKELEQRVKTDERQLRILSDSLMTETTTNSVLQRKLASCQKAKRANIAVASMENGRLREQTKKQERKTDHYKRAYRSCRKAKIENIRKCNEDRRAREKEYNKPKTKLKL